MNLNSDSSLRKIFLYAPFCALILTLLSTHLYGYEAQSQDLDINIIKVVDGDTLKVDINNLSPIFGKNIGARVGGYDAPETRRCSTLEKVLGKQVTQILKHKINSANKIEFKNIRRGKYFRLVVDIYIDGESLCNYMIENNLASPYNGGKKIRYLDYLISKI